MAFEIEVSPQVELRIRKRVLHDSLVEMMRGLGALGFDETIRKGVYERQLLEKIGIDYCTARGIVASFIFTIDWERHQVELKHPEGDGFQIDVKRPVAIQISELFARVVEHGVRLREHLPISQVKIWYNYIPSIRGSPQEPEVDAFLGLTRTGPPRAWDEKNFTYQLQIRAEKLAELGIEVFWSAR
jgi:hypothetical protein